MMPRQLFDWLEKWMLQGWNLGIFYYSHVLLDIYALVARVCAELVLLRKFQAPEKEYQSNKDSHWMAKAEEPPRKRLTTL